MRFGQQIFWITITSFFLVLNGVFGQSIYEQTLLTHTADVPATLVSRRSAVIVMDSREEWKEFSKDIHRTLIAMSIDPVIYIHYQDLHSGATTHQKYLDLMDSRDIYYMIYIARQPERTSMMICAKGKYDLLNVGRKAWYGEGEKFSEVAMKLALKMKSMELERQNYLFPEKPEFVEQVPLFDGIHYKIYPSQVKRFPMAVTKFEKLIIDSTEQIEPVFKERVNNYNREIDNKNEKMQTILNSYSFKFELVDDQPDDQLYDKRFQYVLRMINTTGTNVKKLLKYDFDINETSFVSTIPLENDQRTLKAIPASEPVFKFYLQQTVQHDVYVGRHWDSDTSWEAALHHFLTNMTRSLEE